MIYSMRSKWWSNRRELSEKKFVEVVKKLNFKKNGVKSVEVCLELKGEYCVVLPVSLN